MMGRMQTPRGILRFVVVMLALLLAGCGRDETIRWSPDAHAAFVPGKTSLLVDESGKILGTPLGETESFLDWMPDSKRVLVERRAEAKSWADYEVLLGKERATAV